MNPYPVFSFNTETERLIYEKLQDALGDDYFVFYGRSWKSKSSSVKIDIECDFIIAKQNGGILILEVKGGQWERRNGYWWVYNNPVPDRDNPFVQGRQNKYALLDLLKGNYRWQRVYFPIDYAVALPDSRFATGSVDGEVEILTYSDIGYVQEWVETAMQSCLQRNYPAVCTLEMTEYMTELLMHDYIVKLSDILTSDEKRLLVLTQQQLELDRSLTRQKKLTIQGCAGSGKTLMAIKQVKRLAKQPDVKRILFTCFNLELGEWLQKNTREIDHICITIPILEYFEQKAIEHGKLNGDEVQDNNYYKQLHYKFMEALEEEKIQFDAIVVDEGQMFNKDWWEVLHMLLVDNKNSYFYIFFDDLQRIYRESNHYVPGEEASIDLVVNLRNTARIHQQATKFLPPEKLPDCNNVMGEPVWVSIYNDEKSMKKLLRRYLHKLIVDGGVSSNDIVILTPKSIGKRSHLTEETLGAFRLIPVETDIPGAIRYTSIYKYRGMERQVVILTEFDETVHELEKYVYLGASRAKTKLIVLLRNTLEKDMKSKLIEGCEEFIGRV